MDEQELDKYKDYLLKKGKSENTIRQYYSFLLNYSDWLALQKKDCDALSAKEYISTVSDSVGSGFSSAIKEYFIFKESKEIFNFIRTDNATK